MPLPAVQAVVQDDSNAGMHWGIAGGTAAALPGAFYYISKARAVQAAEARVAPAKAPSTTGSWFVSPGALMFWYFIVACEIIGICANVVLVGLSKLTMCTCVWEGVALFSSSGASEGL